MSAGFAGIPPQPLTLLMAATKPGGLGGQQTTEMRSEYVHTSRVF